jgi:hypothetical protein
MTSRITRLLSAVIITLATVAGSASIAAAGTRNQPPYRHAGIFANKLVSASATRPVYLECFHARCRR